MITADEGVRGGKVFPLKAVVDEAIRECDFVKRVFVATRTGAEVPMLPGRDIPMEEVGLCVCVCSFYTYPSTTLLPRTHVKSKIAGNT